MGRLGNQARVKEWRSDERGEHYAVVEGLSETIPDQPWAEPVDLDPEVARDWLLPPVYDRLIRGEGEFLSELRSAVAIFLKFTGINYDEDDEAGVKLDAYINWVQRVLARYEGFLLDLTIGDKGSYLFAAFGARVTHEDDVDRALAATLELRSPPEDLSFIHDVQIGISRGQVRVGAYGASTRRTYGANGLDVNLAARLMDSAAPGQILASSRIKKEASGHFEFKALGQFPIKGFDEPVEVFVLTNLLIDLKADLLGRSRYPLVGREFEQAVINAGIQELLAGRSRTVLIEGDAGVGKSRLLEYALQQSRRYGMRVLLGSADEIGKTSTYYAWKPVFAQLFALESLAGEPDTENREKLRAQVLEKLAEFAPEQVGFVPLLNTILPLDLPENELTRQMSSEVRASNIRELLVGLLSQAAKAAPLLLAIEDAHRLDSASWALVERVYRSVQPVLLILAHRPFTAAPPDEYDGILGGSQTNRLLLEPFSPSEVAVLARHRLDVDHVTPSLFEFIIEKAEGNPFFSEELIFALRDAGMIRVAGREAQLVTGSVDLNSLNFPDTIQDVIRSRIDCLTPQEQLTLKMSSAIGRVFSFHILYDIYPIEIDKPNLQDYLDTLERLGFIRLESPGADLAYMFKHIITRDVAYNLMLATQRRDLHRAIAEWYEATYRDDLSQVYALLAYHWNQTDQAMTAVEYLDKAGTQAVRNFANREAVELLSAVLLRADQANLKIDAPRRAGWELLLGEAYVNLAEYVKGRRHLETGLSLFGQAVPRTRLGELIGIITLALQQLLHRLLPGFFVGRLASQQANLLAASRACERLVEVYYITSEMPLSLYMAFRTLNLAESAGPSPELARGYATFGALVGFIPLHSVATAYLRRALDTVEGVDDLIALNWVNIAVAFYYTGVGAWANARQLLEEAVAISARLGDQRRWEDGLGVLCALNYFQGKFTASQALANDLIQVARRRNAVHSLAFGLQGKAYALVYQGHESDALGYLEELYALMTVDSKISDDALLMEMYGLFSMVCRHVGDTERALAMAEQAMQLGEKAAPSNFSSFSGYAGPACVYLSLWEAGEAPPEVEKKVVKANKILGRYARVFPIGQPRAWLYTGCFEWLSGRQAAAHKAWNKSLAFAETLEMRHDQGLACLEIGRHLPAGDPQRQVMISRAVELFTTLQAGRDLQRARQALAEI